VKPAVAVMARAPGLGPVKSRLHQALTRDGATALYRCFLLDRLEAVAALAGVQPVLAFTPPEGRASLAALAPPGFRLVAQRGADLGERLDNLLTGLLADGHGGALAIDSDSPTLPMSYVTDAVRCLAEGSADVVLGPCEDGGYYLVGLRAPQPQLFENMPWSTEQVLAVTLARARAMKLRTHLLPPWFDVDTERDLDRLYAEMAAAGGPPRTFAFVSALYREGHPRPRPDSA
jgi:rSAM/selenodomain-associated transferase 1